MKTGPLTLALFLLLPAGLFSATGCAQRSAAETAQSRESRTTAERVSTGNPARKTLKVTSVQPGRIEAFEQTPLYPKLAGYVEAVQVDIGDRVEAGQVLLKLAIPELHDEVKQKRAMLVKAQAETNQAQAAISVAKAAARSAESRVKQAEAGVARCDAECQRWRAEFSRIKQLAANGSVTQKLADETRSQLGASEAACTEAAARIDSARAELEEAKARVELAVADQQTAEAQTGVARADLERVETLVGYTLVKAPFTGVVIARNVDTGHYVQPGGNGDHKPLLTVARTDKVRVFVDLPESEAALADGGKDGDSASVRVQALAGREFKGTITRTSWALDSANRSLRVEIDLENPELELRPGLYATASILLEERHEALVLPITALTREGHDTFCCIVRDGKIERRRIELGLRNGGDVEIRSGLNETDLVVLARVESLVAGQTVNVVNSAE